MNNVNRRKTDNNVNLSYNNEENFDMRCSDEDLPEFESNVFRRNSEKIPVNSHTLINVDPEQPLGLDLNNFMNNVDPDQTIHAISQSNDLPIISEVVYLNSGRSMNNINHSKEL